MSAPLVETDIALHNSAQQSDRDKIEVRIARTLPEVEALREPWTTWGGHRDSDIDFVLMIIESYPEALRPHVIALFRNGQPDAILIGRLERKRMSFKIGYLNVFRPMARCLTFVYGAFRGNQSRENAGTLVREVLECLKRDEADLAVLEFVPTDSELHQFGLSLPSVLGRDSLPAQQAHELMAIPKTIDEVYRRMSSDRRIEVRRRIRKFQAHPDGVPKVVCYSASADMERLFLDAEEIAKKTYQRGLGAGFSDSSDVRKRLELAAQKGWLRANLLYIGNRPIAFWIGMNYGKTFISEYMGYDPEFRKSAPGMYLIMTVLEGICRNENGDSIEQLDFGLGHAEYKQALCTASWMESPVLIFGPTAKGLILKLLSVSTRTADRAARKILASTQFLPRLKRFWRDRLARTTKSPAANPKA
jgi:Acetyltransferase (GNAT) domain